MSDVSSVNNDALSQFGPKPRETADRNELGRNEFLELMIAQMNNQRPLTPWPHNSAVHKPYRHRQWLAGMSWLKGILL